jgi:BirA family biotin operon repressor/biotin-[acetyl-CoA-carboxylase] ligase
MPGSPYSDLQRPPLSARSLERALLVPGGLWRSLTLKEETGSTNADVADAARAGAAEGLIVVAEQQVAGRGRRDRVWVSPARAGLTVSVLLRPADVPQRHWGWLPLLAGVALRDAVQRIAEVDAVLKWPNDLLVGDGKAAGQEAGNEAGKQAADQEAGKTADQEAGKTADQEAGKTAGKAAGNKAGKAAGNEVGKTAGNEAGKAAGILAEVTGDAVVLGIGLNVTTRADELPSTTGLPATSLLLAGARNTDRDPLLRALLRGLAQWYAGWRDAGGDAEMCGLLGAYRRGCATLGRQVRVQLPGGDELAGEATTVDPDGQMVIRTVDGTVHRVSAGDVLHVR